MYTIGNMHSVSSNAVAVSKSYSTTEQKTGGVWIDGKPIYRKVFKTILTRSGDDCWESDLPVATVIPRRYEVLREVNDNQRGLLSYNDAGCYLWPNATYWRLDFANAPIGLYIIIIVEYTKTTD